MFGTSQRIDDMIYHSYPFITFTLLYCYIYIHVHVFTYYLYMIYLQNSNVVIPRNLRRLLDFIHSPFTAGDSMASAVQSLA